MSMRTAIAVLCVLCVAAGATAAPLAERLPARSLYYVGWAGRSLTFDGSMFGQLLQEPRVAELVDLARKASFQAVGGDEQARRMVAHGWQTAGIVWQHPIALSVLDVRPSEGGGPPAVEAVLLIDLGQDRDAFDEHLQVLIEPLVRQEMLVQKTAGTVTYRSTQLPVAGEVGFGYMKNTFFVAVGSNVPQELTEVAPARSLATVEKFAACVGAVSGENEQAVRYLDVAAALERFYAVAPPSETQDIPRVLAILGMDRVTAFADAVRVVDRGMLYRGKVFSPAPHRGVLGLLAGAPLDEADVAVAPPDAIYLGAMRLSPEAAYAELRRMLREFDAEADEEFAAELARAEEELGVSLALDVLAPLGDVWTVASAPSQGGFPTGTMLTATVKDPEHLQATIDKLTGRLLPPAADDAMPQRGPRIRKLKVGRTEISYVGLSGMYVPVAPAWAIREGRLHVALWPQVIAASLGSEDDASLTDAERFRSVRGQVSRQASMLEYVDVPAVVRQVYPALLLLWTFGANTPEGAEFGAAPEWLPDLATFEKYVWPQVGAMSSDDDGLILESYGSIPVPTMLTVPMAAGAAMSRLATARAEAQKVAEATTMRTICISLMMYSEDHNGRLPDKLDASSLRGYIDADSPIWSDIQAGKFAFPAAGRNLRQMERAGGLKHVMAPILLYPRERTDQRVQACIANGAVVQLTEQELQETLSEMKQRDAREE